MLSRGMRWPRLVSSARFVEVAHAPPRGGRSATWLAGPLAPGGATRGRIPSASETREAFSKPSSRRFPCTTVLRIHDFAPVGLTRKYSPSPSPCIPGSRSVSTLRAVSEGIGCPAAESRIGCDRMKGLATVPQQDFNELCRLRAGLRRGDRTVRQTLTPSAHQQSTAKRRREICREAGLSIPGPQRTESPGFGPLGTRTRRPTAHRGSPGVRVGQKLRLRCPLTAPPPQIQRRTRPRSKADGQRPSA